jgi:hypothetical protein
MYANICMKKVQIVVKTALFYLKVLSPRARSEGMGPLRCWRFFAQGHDLKVWEVGAKTREQETRKGTGDKGKERVTRERN